MTGELVPMPTAASVALRLADDVPVLITAAGEQASMRFLEFFAANIRNPYTQDGVSHHPPRVLPTGVKGLAQDESLESAFAWANTAFRSAYAEGMVWLGYADLALLAQRAEYRVISEEIASEMTREWIELKSTAEDDDKADKIKELNDELDNFNVR